MADKAEKAEKLDALTLKKVNDFVDDDLLSCFLWAAGENAVATPGWESPSVNPLKGILITRMHCISVVCHRQCSLKLHFAPR